MGEIKRKAEMPIAVTLEGIYVVVCVECICCRMHTICECRYYRILGLCANDNAVTLEFAGTAE